MLRRFRVLGARWTETGLLTAAALLLGAFIAAVAAVVTAVTLTLTLPHEDRPAGFGVPPGADKTVIAPSVPHAAADRRPRGEEMPSIMRARLTSSA